MESQGYSPNFLNIKCSWHIILLHVYEKTIADDSYTFTSVDIYYAFGCDPHSAIQIINRGILVGSFSKVKDIKGKPYYFKLTKSGKRNAERLIMRQLISDEESSPHAWG